MIDAPEKTEWTIGELATEFNATFRTLRFYEEKGILSPIREGARDQVRIYGQTDRWNLKAVLKARSLGFTVEEAKELLHDEGELMLTDEQIAKQLKELDRMKTEAEGAIAYLTELAA
jgi:DNA-binding transcriptional MerR regulator